MSNSPFIVSGDSKPRDPVPQGMYMAACHMLVGLGTQEDNYQGSPVIKNQIRLGWQIPELRATWEAEDGTPQETARVIGQTFTRSLDKKSNLYKALVSWRGKDFTPEERAGFDMSSIVGAPCQLQVLHKTSATTGNIYAYVGSVVPIPKGVERPKVEGEPTLWDIPAEGDIVIPETIPNWIRDEIMKSKEYVERMQSPTAHTLTPGQTTDSAGYTPEVDDEDDDLPF